MSKVSKSPIYESFAMLHPSGDLMCYTNKKRANWYIKLGLAKWINDNTFQLRFEPKGKGKSHLPFYTQKMQNICVMLIKQFSYMRRYLLTSQELLWLQDHP